MFQELLLCVQQHLGKVVDQSFWTMWFAQEMNPAWLNANIQALLGLNFVTILKMQGSYAQVKWTTTQVNATKIAACRSYLNISTNIHFEYA